MDVGKAVSEIKSGKYRTASIKVGNMHSLVGKVSFSADQHWSKTSPHFTETMLRAKPQTVKGTYVQNFAISSTMGPGQHQSDSISV